LAFEKLRTRQTPATQTRVIHMTRFGFSEVEALEADGNLQKVVDCVNGKPGGTKLTMSGIAKALGINVETVGKKLVIAVDNGLLPFGLVKGGITTLPAVVQEAVDRASRGESFGSASFSASGSDEGDDEF
jgi:hypothetical protein